MVHVIFYYFEEEMAQWSIAFFSRNASLGFEFR